MAKKITVKVASDGAKPRKGDKSRKHVKKIALSEEVASIDEAIAITGVAGEPEITEPEAAELPHTEVAELEPETQELESDLEELEPVEAPKKRRFRRSKHPKVIQPLTLLAAQAPAKNAFGPVKSHKRRYITITLVVLALLIGASAAFLYIRHSNTPKPEQSLAAKVAALAGVGGDTNPAILSVTDANALAQPFLKGAQDGDKVVLFYLAKKAVIYRPSTNKIVKVGAFEPPLPKVFIRKGADGVDVDKLKKQIAALKAYQLTSSDQSANGPYLQTMIIDLNNRYPDAAAKLATELHGQVVGLPDGEIRPDGDILVIAIKQ